MGVAIVGALFVLYTQSKGDLAFVAYLGTLGWGTFAAPLVPVVAIGFNWKRGTALAANVAIIASLVVNFGIQFSPITVPYGIHGSAVALLVSLTLYFGISLASKPPELDPDIAKIMDL